LGFDAAVEFPPHNIRGSRLDRSVTGLHPEFRGKVHDYREAVSYFAERPEPPYLLHRSAMVGWDNTPRRGLNGHVWHHATPDAYGRWLRAAIERSSDPEDPEPLVFVNAWNEWAEGAVLEPDQTWGHAFQQETRRALFAGRDTACVTPTVTQDARWEALKPGCAPLARANAWLRAEVEARDARTTPRRSRSRRTLRSGSAGALRGRRPDVHRACRRPMRQDPYPGARQPPARIAGWAFPAGIDGDGEKASAGLVCSADA
jgi:hypothetical protein